MSLNCIGTLSSVPLVSDRFRSSVIQALLGPKRASFRCSSRLFQVWIVFSTILSFADMVLVLRIKRRGVWGEEIMKRNPPPPPLPSDSTLSLGSQVLKGIVPTGGRAGPARLGGTRRKKVKNHEKSWNFMKIKNFMKFHDFHEISLFSRKRAWILPKAENSNETKGIP